MRELHECQAEVFRRSEKRIKERKQRRKHILLACIPLVICITLFSAFFLRDTNRAAPEAPVATRPAMNVPCGDWDGSSPGSVLRVEVSGLDFSRIYTDTAEIMLISDQLCSYGQPKPEAYEEPTESVADGEYKESVDTDEQHSIIADSGISGTLKEDATGENYNGSSGNDDLYGVTSDSANSGYRITLMTDAGNQIEYYLSGNVLENRTTNQSRKLTQLEVYTLKELLGIPLP
jgi:hypothetical protein